MKKRGQMVQGFSVETLVVVATIIVLVAAIGIAAYKGWISIDRIKNFFTFWR